MKRLTGRRDECAYIIGCPDFALPKIAGLIIQQTVDRLAAIEDILGEEYDLKDIERAFWCKKVVKDAFSDDTQVVERLRELWFADQKGHCIVFDERYPVVSEYYRDEEGWYIRESSGVISEAEYKKVMGDG